MEVGAKKRLAILDIVTLLEKDIYFGHKDKVYVINKQLIINVFGVCAKRYVEEPKGQVSKSLTIRHYRVVDLHLHILLQINGMQRVWVCHTMSNILPLYLSFIKRKRYNIFATKMLRHC